MKPIFAPLPVKELGSDLKEFYKRVLFFDPTLVYKNYNVLNVYDRINPRRLELAFPKVDTGYCACGCGVKLKGRQRRWANVDCTRFAMRVVDVIAGITDSVRRCLVAYNGGEFCCNCGCEAEIKYRKDGTSYTTMEVDHIIPVHKGGGACWLNNYQLLCADCHKKKTKCDLNKKAATFPQPPSLGTKK